MDLAAQCWDGLHGDVGGGKGVMPLRSPPSVGQGMLLGLIDDPLQGAIVEVGVAEPVDVQEVVVRRHGRELRAGQPAELQELRVGFRAPLSLKGLVHEPGLGLRWLHHCGDDILGADDDLRRGGQVRHQVLVAQQHVAARQEGVHDGGQGRQAKGAQHGELHEGQGPHHWSVPGGTDGLVEAVSHGLRVRLCKGAPHRSATQVQNIPALDQPFRGLLARHHKRDEVGLRCPQTPQTC
mmetsp:Transcript_126434/g.219095  ORF Transcript_126434/g.219095 Transcript_126434/m.219095 type:complete len:237 (+) Transcript_126434:1240-1950(+)